MLTDILAGLDAGSPVLLLSAGALIGLVHAFEPDHVAAVATQVSGRPGGAPGIRRGALKGCVLGALWGLGHTSGIILVSVLVLALSLSVPDIILEGFEFLVGVMLVVLGASVFLNRRMPGAVHSHPHGHGDTVHSHPHGHGGGHRHGHKSYLIGCVHGLAGSGVMIAVAAPLLGDAPAVMAFYLVFGAGSILGMAAASGAMSVPACLNIRPKWAGKAARLAVGAVSVAVGLSIVLI